jgi:hypothetical protein
MIPATSADQPTPELPRSALSRGTRQLQPPSPAIGLPVLAHVPSTVHTSPSTHSAVDVQCFAQTLVLVQR